MGQLRQKAKALSQRVKEGDRDAAVELLRHSVRLGHGKLALRRFFLARAMGAEVSKDELRCCASIFDKLPREMTDAMAAEEHRKATHYMKRKKTDG